MPELKSLFDPYLHQHMATFISQTLIRLLVAGFLGGIIGLERELKHRPAGLRTNLCICFGAAMFTILSSALAGTPADSARIAAQIIPGIGFIGAGSILHQRTSVQGLTTAATIFVVASIGMAAGGGLMLSAVSATVLLLFSLVVLGKFEGRWEKRPQTVQYELEGPDFDELLSITNAALSAESLTMRSVQIIHTDGNAKIIFTIDAAKVDQARFRERMRSSDVLQKLRAFSVQEQE
jgi:putative Mg2+ transporter-C (MgtC) family protein